MREAKICQRKFGVGAKNIIGKDIDMKNVVLVLVLKPNLRYKFLN